MSKAEQAKYLEKRPVAVYPMTNWGGIEIMDVLYGIDDRIVYRFNFGTPDECHVAKIRYGANHDSFKTTAGYSIRLDECMRV
jgi:hypothetical protein